MKTINQITYRLAKKDKFAVDELIDYAKKLESFGINPKKVFHQVEDALSLETVNWMYQQFNSTGNLESLTEELKVLKLECETRIDSSLKDFIQRGKDFAFIRDNKLYREEYCSWATYCRAKFGIYYSTADRLIAAYQVAEQLQPIGGSIPNESVARQLYSIKEVERPEAWRKLLNQSKQLNKSITASMVLEVKREMQGDDVSSHKVFSALQPVQVHNGAKFITWGLFEETIDDTTYLHVGIDKLFAAKNEYVSTVKNESILTNVKKIMRIIHEGKEEMTSIAKVFLKYESLASWQIDIINNLHELLQ